MNWGDTAFVSQTPLSACVKTCPASCMRQDAIVSTTGPMPQADAPDGLGVARQVYVR